MSRKRQRTRYVVVAATGGDYCPRCGQSTEIREHDEITAKHLRQPYYFSRWFFCTNPQCSVTLHMAERYKVHNAHVKAKEVAEAAERGQVVWGDTWDNEGVDMRTPPWE